MLRRRTKKQSNISLSGLQEYVYALGSKFINEIISTLFATRPRNIQRGANLLNNEHLTLQQIRERRSLSQADLAEAMHFTQTQVEEIENRTDMYVSTVRRQVEAMEGRLDLVVSFPGQYPSILRGVGDLTKR